MSAVTSIVLADAQATPVNHTFVPLGPDANGVWWFEDQSRPSAIGYWKVSLSLTRPKAPGVGASSLDRMARVKIGIHIPALETVANNSAGLTPAPTVAYIPRLQMEAILPERATLQDRKDLRKMAALVLADAAVVSMMESLQGIY